jgi:hypothetical protein
MVCAHGAEGKMLIRFETASSKIGIIKAQVVWVVCFDDNIVLQSDAFVCMLGRKCFSARSACNEVIEDEVRMVITVDHRAPIPFVC